MAYNNLNYYQKLFNDFTPEKIQQRYETLFDLMNEFIKRKGYEKNVHVVPSILNQMILDYFTDIKRLKEFHEIEHINFLKIHAYSAYWLLKRKPIQIIKDDENNVQLAFVNEQFITSYLINFLTNTNRNALIIEEDRDEFLEFVKNLEYTFRYRTITPQMIETMLEAYDAGKIFQRADYYEKESG